MTLALLFFINSAGGFYIYLRFAPKKWVMVHMSAEEYNSYHERLPPITLLSNFGRKLALLACVCIAISLLLFSKLLLAV
ncbi:MAG: hypothetical protein Q9M17_00685 [Mariprofundus sp.]|nr:hypothetical protein [Mariprofundus sp.]